MASAIGDRYDGTLAHDGVVEEAVSEFMKPRVLYKPALPKVVFRGNGEAPNLDSRGSSSGGNVSAIGPQAQPLAQPELTIR